MRCVVISDWSKFMPSDLRPGTQVEGAISSNHTGPTTPRRFGQNLSRPDPTFKYVLLLGQIVSGTLTVCLPFQLAQNTVLQQINPLDGRG